MAFVGTLSNLNRGLVRILDWGQPVFALGARCYVSLPFLKSGYLKITAWDNTLYLFENEYHTPVLSPHLAALAGTFGEFAFPTLLVLGLASRWAATGLFAVNALAVISYSNVLLAAGYEAALASHVLWGAIAAFLVFYGPSKLSLDYAWRRQAV